MLSKFTLKYEDVPANPTLYFAKEMVEKARGSEEITSIGGGSTIDVGKYIAFMLGIPHTAIPTTAGTGSEVTKFAVFIKDGKKVTLELKEPENYILNAENVLSLDKLQTASSGLDALCQGVESYWSKYATDESRHWAKLAIRLASKNLLESYKYPNSQILRLNMLVAANYSGRAINISKTSICHAISYPLTVHYGVPHGIACAHTLAFFINYFNFRWLKSYHVHKLLDAISGRVKIKYDVNLVASEAFQEIRAKNTPRPVSLEVIKRAL